MSRLAMRDHLRFYARASWQTMRRGQLNRQTGVVLDEYSSSWIQYAEHLRNASTLDAWLRISGVEDAPSYYNVDGKLAHEAFDSLGYYRNVLSGALRRYFPSAHSVSEFGCGLGRNLLFLKRQLPELECCGYELCQPGVDVARAAAAKFGCDVHYAQLDYLYDPPEKYVFPPVDVAFTMFSLEQIPKDSAVAMRNILAHAKQGSIHIEPVPENYPLNIRGILGKIEHRKVDYLSGFDKVVRNLGLNNVKVEKVASAHNPLMYPSMYILRKA
jgi:SAM-dependent methyltransferase